jgi:quercetin dioxygenase-like cupin family protein
MSKAAGWSLLRFAADWVGGWHCTPYRQWVFVMAGQATVRVSDGSQCELRAGSICLLEDTRGKGHLTTIIGSDEVLMVAIRIPNDEPAA